MAVTCLSECLVADLCLGKPPLRSVPATATIADALAALKSSEDSFIAVWSSDQSPPKKRSADQSVCLAKLCMVDIICFLSREDNLASPEIALKAPVSALIKVNGAVRHVEPHFSLIDAIDLMLGGTQNLVVPIKSSAAGNWKRKQLPKSSSGREFCWLTREDVIRFLLSSIGLFSPIPALSVDDLGVITSDFSAVAYHRPASSAIDAISRSLADQTSVAVVEDDGTLIGEISPLTLSCCDETAAAAVTTLSALDLMAYIDGGEPPEELVKVVEERLKKSGLDGMLKEFVKTGSPYGGDQSNSSSSDEELTALPRQRRISRCSSLGRTAEAIVCHPGSSLVAVMIQAITHRVNYVWVIEEDCRVVGIVTFAKILEVFRERLE